MSEPEGKNQDLLNEIARLRERISELEQSEEEHRQTEEALRESEAKYSVLVEHSKDGVLIVQDGVLKFMNTESLRYMGYTAEELIGTDFLRLVAPEHRDEVMQRHIERMAGKKVPTMYELDLITKSGEPIVVEVNVALIEYDGRPASLVFIRNITDRKLMEQELRQTRDKLGIRVKERTAELEASYEKLKNTLNSTVQAIATIVESRDPYTAGHQRRVAKLCVAIAGKMEFDADAIEGLRVAAMVHDIGKIYVPAEILSKPGRLPEVEYLLVKNHTQVGYNILREIDFPWPVAEIVLQHHEYINGSGYPSGRKGKDILIEARIICVADVIEAMATHRPYRPSLGIDFALQEVNHNKGILYDSEIVDVCLDLFKEAGFGFD